MVSIDSGRCNKRHKSNHSPPLPRTAPINSEDDSMMMVLPIYRFREDIVQCVRKHQTTIVVGDTGTGKSTQIPQFLMDEYARDGKCIAITQPRRVAAITIAQKVASEQGGIVGDTVGYSIRFEDKTSHRTRIKFVTDGVLLRECMADRLLSRYSVVILDEAHERSLQTDILMGLLKDVQLARPDLRIIVMSATIETELFARFFHDSCVIQVPGRQFPVHTFYTREPEADFIEAAMLTCLQIHEDEESGGVLVFLPGQDDIEALQQLLLEYLPYCKDRTQTTTTTAATDGDDRAHGPAFLSNIRSQTVVEEFMGNDGALVRGVVQVVSLLPSFEVCPLYASMPADEQLRVFSRPQSGVRRFVLSTNIAETSVTVSGIKYVVDAGFVKTRFITSQTGTEMLKVVPVSKFQADQRKGRAGRESAGKCFRLFTEAAFDKLPAAPIPEVQRANLAQVILQLKVLGVASIDSFSFLSPPADMALENAYKSLLLLGAISKDQSLTAHGARMALLPLDPLFSHLLLKAEEFQCVDEALTAVSILSSDNLFLQPHRDDEKRAACQAHRSFASKDGDLVTLLQIYNKWLKVGRSKEWARKHYLSIRALQHAHSVRDQLSTLLVKAKVDVQLSCWPDKEPFLKCLLSGLIVNVAQRSATYQTGSTTAANTNNNSSSSSSNIVSKQQLNDRKWEQMRKNAAAMNSSGASRIHVLPPPPTTTTIAAAAAPASQSIVSHGRFNYSTTARPETTPLPDDTAAPYRTLRGLQPVHVHPSSVLFNTANKKLPEYLVYAELLITSKQYMRNVSAVEGAWLTELYPTRFKAIGAAADDRQVQ